MLFAVLCFVAYQYGRVTRDAGTCSCTLLLVLAFTGVMLHFRYRQTRARSLRGAIFNVWLMAVTVRLIKPDLLRPLHSGFWKRVAAVFIISLLGNNPVFSPSSTIDKAADALGISATSFEEELDECDPGWKDFLSFELNKRTPGKAAHQ